MKISNLEFDCDSLKSEECSIDVDFSAEPISALTMLAETTSPYSESALVTAICQERKDEDTALPPCVSIPPSTALSTVSEGDEEEYSVADRVKSRRRQQPWMILTPPV